MKRTDMESRRQDRLKKINELVLDYSNKASVTKKIKVAEQKAADINARVGNQFLDFKRDYIYVTRGLLEVEKLPSLFLERLVAHEVAHVRYRDNLLRALRQELALFPNSKDSDLKRMVITLVELRADIMAAQLVGIYNMHDHSVSHCYSSVGFKECFSEAGYPDRDFRIFIANKHKRFTRATVVEAFNICKKRAAENGVRFSISNITELDKYVATLNKDWLANWPK